MNIADVKCRFCAAAAALLDNPYQYSGQVVAKLCVNAATAIWAIVVFVKPDALRTWPGSAFSGSVYTEDVFATVLLVISGFALVRLFRHRRPLMFGACAYGAMLLLWLYTWTTLVVAISNGITAARPGQLAGVTVITALALFAFVSNPKRTRDGSPSA